MKKCRAILFVLLALLVPASMLAGCGGNGDTTPAVTTAPPAPTELANLSEYVVVYPYDPPAAVFRAAREVRDAIQAATGVSLSLREDFVGAGAVPVGTLEILIGVTNRPESTSHYLGKEDYGVYFENGRLVISGGTTEAILRAVELFKEGYLTDGKLKLPATPDILRGDYPVKDATLLGTTIYDYVIVRDNDNIAAATLLQARIADATGAVLPIYTQRQATNTDREIVVGSPTGEGRAHGAAAAGGWVIEASGTRFLLYGDGHDGTYSAAIAYLSVLENATASALDTAKRTGTATDMALFNLNLSKSLPSLADKLSLTMSADAVLERFLATKEELPDEVTVVERVDIDRYPASALRTVYVSPDGDDKAAGTEEAPLASLSAALKLMQNTSGGIIYMKAGMHSLTETVKLSAAHSGTRQSPLFIKSYGEGEAFLTANTAISTDSSLWHYVDAAENVGVYERLPEAARDAVMYTSLADHGLDVYDIAEITTSGPPRLYVGGEEYTIARYPNDTGDPSDLLYFTHVYDSGSVTVQNGSNLYWPWVERATAAGKDPATWVVGWEIRIPSDARGQEILSWVNTGDIWFYGSTFEGWEFGYYNIADVTEGVSWSHTVNGDPYVDYVGYLKNDGYYSLKSDTPNKYGAKHSTNSPARRNTYYLFNAVEAMDAPGEWYLDRETGYLYVYPTQGGLAGKQMSVSSPASFNLLDAVGVEYLVLDGIGVDGSNAAGINLSGVQNAVVQNGTFKNTKNPAMILQESIRDTAVIYSDFSQVYSVMLNTWIIPPKENLTPTGVVIQNNLFHDAAPTCSTAIALSGCRTVVSHNYFVDTVLRASNAAECIAEYNLFEGGSADVTDGGMIYTGGEGSRGNHYRYNLFHSFHATHNALYFDTMNGGNYAYGNTISFLGSASNSNKGWYSSTGMGNVCFGNVILLRNPYQVAETQGNTVGTSSVGDSVNESNLFYYYFGDEYSAGGAAAVYAPVAYDGTRMLANGATLSQSLAGHWWQGNKESEVSTYLEKANQTAWTARDPAYMNHLQGTKLILAAYTDEGSDYHPKYFYVPWYLSGKTFTYELPAGTELLIPQYSYKELDGTVTVIESRTETVGEDGEITLTYEEIAAMERFRRQPACCVIRDNVLLGGTPTVEGGLFTEIADPAKIITDNCKKAYGYVSTSHVADNWFEYLYATVMPNAEQQDYTLTDAAWQSIADTVSPEGYRCLQTGGGLWYKAGPTQ